MPIAASAFFIYNLRGDCLISKIYRDDVPKEMREAFRAEIQEYKEMGSCPVKSIEGCNFMYLKHNNIYVVTVTNTNANAALAFKFMVDTIALFRSYFQGAVNENSICGNFVLIYELLDEIMDFGYPQILAPEALKLYITQRPAGLDALLAGQQKQQPLPMNATLQVTGAVSWRREGLFYKKNEVFLDIVESVNVLMKADGTVLRSDVNGQVTLKCFLSGMPELKLGLNDRLGMENDAKTANPGSKVIELDDVVFHQCVNLGRFNAEKTVSFVPPDGEFELMRYRVTEGINLPFRVLPIVQETGRTRVQVNVKLKSLFAGTLFAANVIVKIPVPKNAAKALCVVSNGKAKYVAKENALVWKIKRMPGSTEASLSAEVELVATLTQKKTPWSRPPVSLGFQVPMFTASGLRVRFLKVWEKSNYQTIKWVRYIAKAGSFDVRL